MTAVAKPNQGEGDDMKTDEQLSPRECISALMDGELSGDDWAAAVALTQDDDEALADWQLYHLVGDVLRSSDLAAGRHDNAFVTRLSARLQAEAPVALQPQAAAPAVVALPQQPLVQPAANDGVFRWKMVAGLASVVAVAAVGWQMWGIAQPAEDAAEELGVDVAAPLQRRTMDEGDEARHRGGDVGVEDADADVLVHRQRAPAVEAPPAEPKDHGPERAPAEAVGVHPLELAVS